MVAFPAGTPALNMVAGVVDPSAVNLSDGYTTTLTAGKQGELLVREMGGRFLANAQRGNLFIASTLIAGVTLPVLDDTAMAATAGMVNPTNSGKNVEVLGIGISSVTVEVALKQMGIGFQLGYSALGVPTSVTRLTSYGMPLSAGPRAAQAYAFSAATMTNAVLAPLLFPFGNFETAVGFFPSFFDLTSHGLLLGPDTVMTIGNTTTALAAVNLTYVWSEWTAG